MLKQLTLAVLTGALLPACILSTDDSTTSISESSTGTTGPTSTTDPTSGTTEPETTDGTTTVTPTTDDSTTETPTTGSTSVGTITTDSTTSTTSTTDGTTEATTGQSGYGKCGWFAADKYYACEEDGAVASLEDPDMISPIACADGLEEGAKCDEEAGPVKGVGCCTPEGTLYFCDSQGTNAIIKQECGA